MVTIIPTHLMSPAAVVVQVSLALFDNPQQEQPLQDHLMELDSGIWRLQVHICCLL